MTALFVVIFLEQWKNKEGNISSIVGIVVSAICLIFLGLLLRILRFIWFGY